MAATVSLNDDQMNGLKQRIPGFQQYMKTDEFKEDQTGRQRRVGFFHDLLDRLDEFSEADVEDIVRQLWATQMWANKAYFAQKLIRDNGIDKLRDHIRALIDNDAPEAAYANFRAGVKGFGAASITEMLAYLHPDRCGIWNRQAREALKLLGFAQTVNVNKYDLTANEYRQVNSLLASLAAELSNAGLHDVDLLLVNFFLFEVVHPGPIGSASPHGSAVTGFAGGKFDHDEIRDMIEQIGDSLGFEADKEVNVAHGAAGLGLVENAPA